MLQTNSDVDAEVGGRFKRLGAVLGAPALKGAATGPTGKGAAGFEKEKFGGGAKEDGGRDPIEARWLLWMLYH
jgi:hypothetical protein